MILGSTEFHVYSVSIFPLTAHQYFHRRQDYIDVCRLHLALSLQISLCFQPSSGNQLSCTTLIYGIFISFVFIVGSKCPGSMDFVTQRQLLYYIFLRYRNIGSSSNFIEKQYLFIFSENRIDIFQSEKLENWHHARVVTVFRPPPNTMYSAQLWSPELHYIRNNFYIYFAGSDGNNANHRMYALRADDALSPMGSYNFMGKVAEAGRDLW